MKIADITKSFYELQKITDLIGISLFLHYYAKSICTNFLIYEKIKDILENIGPEHVSAIVSDNVANVRNVRAKIHEKYSHIENIHCISHCINLVANDIVNYAFANHLLCQINTLVSTFHNSHLAVNTTLDWSYSPVADKPKKSKKSDKTSMKVSPKTHEKTSKPEKDSKKTSKNSTKKDKKKKKKSSDKKQNKNMILLNSYYNY
ncbi:uncharacterized protein LOC101234788 [Rhizophagus clarus]|uniref:Uncharacterized protein LOC101234788 n=1 Tax=Rhizophagus clarus TaxID=94130 RepID=A0A8H3LYI0_9GLOM|nr:uncharacterized protein LOC101234788 [Rhizophagus clarus]